MSEGDPVSASPAEKVLSAVSGSYRSKRNPEEVVARAVAESKYDPFGGNLAIERRVVRPRVGPVNPLDAVPTNILSQGQGVKCTE